MKVLAIGNSFSEDATRYLHQIAKADGTDLLVFNMFIPGCPLRKHYMNMLSDEKAYIIHFNGETIPGLKFSLKETLISNEWDIVTLQQVSCFSPDYKTYQPYLDALAEFVRKYAPQAKIYMHHVWAYADGSPLLEKYNFKSAKDMYEKGKKAYAKAAKAIHADGIIHSGDAMQAALKKGVEKIHRDTYHATYGFGRYLLGLVWYKTLTGNSVLENTLNEFDEPISEKEIAIAKEIAEKIK